MNLHISSKVQRIEIRYIVFEINIIEEPNVLKRKKMYFEAADFMSNEAITVIKKM